MHSQLRWENIRVLVNMAIPTEYQRDLRSEFLVWARYRDFLQRQEDSLGYAFVVRTTDQRVRDSLYTVLLKTVDS